MSGMYSNLKKISEISKSLKEILLRLEDIEDRLNNLEASDTEDESEEGSFLDDDVSDNEEVENVEQKPEDKK